VLTATVLRCKPTTQGVILENIEEATRGDDLHAVIELDL